MSGVKIIECPRDAMQGMDTFIETDFKATYINQLLRCGFDTLDFGSFVSPKAIPQMRDTAALIEELDLYKVKTELLAIVANERGAQDALEFEQIEHLGFPFSVSETFQKRNANSSISESFIRVEEILNMVKKKKKNLVVYISMGFGNPYKDPWSTDIVARWVENLSDLGVKTISLADTVGVASPKDVEDLYKTLVLDFPHVEFGAHFHARPDNWKPLVEAAYDNGCMRFDGAINGLGGCPMATDKLVGNIATENLLEYFMEEQEPTGINMDEFIAARKLAEVIFSEIED